MAIPISTLGIGTANIPPITITKGKLTGKVQIERPPSKAPP